MKRFKHWINKIVGIGCLCVALGVVAPHVAFATDSCECFCGDKTQGAGTVGEKGSANECAQTCGDAKTTYVGCYTDESLYPANNNLCWTQDECESYPIRVATENYTGEWSEQNAYCSKQPVTGSAMGYCYGPLIPVVLNVPILGVTNVGSLGDYVNLVYKYAIPIASLFAALMFTIAGFQYMTAAGDKSAVSKAKGRMVNTVIGIVLLMSVYTIAYLIDPRLTRFNELRPPLVKKAVLVNDATTCEALYGYGFCIDGDCKESDSDSLSGACGDKGEITDDSGVNLNIVDAPKVGETCYYSGCDDKSKTCLMKGDNSGGTCIACNDISQLNTKLGITPSASVCGQIASRAQTNDANPKHVYSCYFDDDFSSLSESDAAGADECVQFYTSGKSYVDCYFLESYAVDGEDGCDAYGYMEIDSYGVSPSGLFATFFSTGTADQVEDFKTQFGSICQQDICGLADKGTTPQGSCNFEDSSTAQDVADWWASSFGASSLFDSYGCIGSTHMAEAKASASTSSIDYDAGPRL